jgi:hypothetical protein
MGWNFKKMFGPVLKKPLQASSASSVIANKPSSNNVSSVNRTFSIDSNFANRMYSNKKKKKTRELIGE